MLSHRSLEQFGVRYDLEKPPSYLTDEQYQEVRKRSASYHALKLFSGDNKTCVPPTQIMLGADDVRVPTSQGIAWYHCLKGNGCQVNLLVFPDSNHSLNKIWTRPKTLEAQVDFLVRHSKFD